MIPTRGQCHSIFLLIHALKLKQRASFSELHNAAENLPLLLAKRLDLKTVIKFLVENSLAGIQDGRVVIDPQLMQAGDEACHETFANIARIVMKAAPANWMFTAIQEGEVRAELLPDQDIASLDWLLDSRDPILVSVHQEISKTDNFRIWLGELGERITLEIEKSKGRHAFWASKVSDAFGYDVASNYGEGRDLIEVKTTVVGKKDGFFITRHECDVAQKNLRCWRIQQVILSPDVLTADTINRNHVLALRSLPATELLNFLPQDSAYGRWLETARLCPPDSSWIECVWSLTDNWSVEGYKKSSRPKQEES